MKHLLLEIAGVNSEKEFYDKYKSKNDFLSAFPEAADLLNTLPQAKNGGTLLPKTITCSNCGWSWKAADGGNDVGTCHKCGNENKIMKYGGLTKYQSAGQVTYGTPEYRDAYNRGEVVTDEGVRSPILLDEVTVQNNYKRPRGFWEQYADKIAEENKDAGPLGAAVGVPISAAFSLPQLAIVKGINNLPTLFGQQSWNDGKMQRPAEAMGIENPFGAFATDLFLDPANLIGAGVLTKEKALAKLGAIKESGLMSKFFPEKNYTLPEVPSELNLDVNSPRLNMERVTPKVKKKMKPEWHELDLGNGLIEQTPLRKGLNDNVVKRIKINDKGSITLKHYKDADGKTVYFFSADVAEGGLNAGKAYKQLEKFIPKGSKILEQKSLSTDSFYNVLRRAQNPKQFTWVDEGSYIPLNNSGVNRAFSNADKAFPNSMDLKFENFNEAKKALNELNARITIEGMPKAKLSKIVDEVQLIENGPWVKQTRFGIDIPNIGLIKQYQRAGTVKPIYVESKNDPRYKAYNDSLLLYKLSERQRLKGTNNKENILFNKKGTHLQEMAKDYGYFNIKDGHFFPNSKVAIIIQGEDDRKKPNSLENDYNNDEYVHPNIAPVKGYNWSTETGFRRLVESSDNFLYKKPEQQVIVRPTIEDPVVEETVQDRQRILISAIKNNLHPAGLVYGNTDLYSDLPTIRPTARNAKSYKVRETTQGIYGPSTVDYEVTDPRNINMNDLGPGNTREITPRYQVGGRSEEDLVQGQPLEEVVVYGKPTEFGSLRNSIKKQNSWEQFANDRFLGNFERNMGQTINNLSDSRKQEYEDYINKLTFDEYVKTHPMLRGEKRGEYIDRIQRTNANSPNFQRAYDANAEYNPSTDVNNWRKGLMGIGSVLLGPDNINKLKQSSRYFSSKEKSDMLRNPISAAAETTLGTFAPLEIPANMAYGENNNWSDALSGRGTYVPMSGRLLADPMILAGEAAPLIGEGLSAAAKVLGDIPGPKTFVASKMLNGSKINNKLARNLYNNRILEEELVAPNVQFRGFSKKELPDGKFHNVAEGNFMNINGRMYWISEGKYLNGDEGYTLVDDTYDFMPRPDELYPSKYKSKWQKKYNVSDANPDNIGRYDSNRYDQTYTHPDDWIIHNDKGQLTGDRTWWLKSKPYKAMENRSLLNDTPSGRHIFAKQSALESFLGKPLDQHRELIGDIVKEGSVPRGGITITPTTEGSLPMIEGVNSFTYNPITQSMERGIFVNPKSPVISPQEGLLTDFHNAPHLESSDYVSNNIKHMQKLKENNYVFQNKVKPEASVFDQPLSTVNKTNEANPYATQFDPEEMDPLLDFMYQEKDINDIKNSIKAEVVRYPVTKRLFTDPDPKRVDQFYSAWADKIHPSLSLEVTPSEMRRVHQEALDYFGNSRQIFDKDLGAYMTSRLRNKIPAYNEPVVRDANGARQMFAKDQRSATTFDRWYPERTNTDYIPSFSFAEMGPENLHATDLYTRGYDATINSLFRNNNFAPSKVNMYNEIAENLQNAILKNKISKPTSVRRGIVDDYELELLNPESFQPTGVRKFRSQLAEGDVFRDDAFMSTSRDLRHDWGEQSLAEKINIPGGNIQSYFHPDSGSFSHFNVTENEFLLPKGLVRRVKRTLDPAIENAGFETEILNPYKKGGYPHLFW